MLYNIAEFDRIRDSLWLNREHEKRKQVKENMFVKFTKYGKWHIVKEFGSSTNCKLLEECIATKETCFEQEICKNCLKSMTWEDRIKMAEKNGKFTREDTSRAKDWHTCAIAEKYTVFSIFKEKSAYEIFSYLYRCREAKNVEKISSLGVNFSHAVRDNNVEKAKEIYVRIQNLK